MLWVILTAAGLCWLAGYAIACTIWPWASCKKCGGAGIRQSPTGRAFRNCPRCKGSPRRLRTGRRILNAAGVLRRDGS